jgi:hypothetical protein
LTASAPAPHAVLPLSSLLVHGGAAAWDASASADIPASATHVIMVFLGMSMCSLGGVLGAAGPVFPGWLAPAGY